MAVDDEESKDVEEEGDPEEADNFDCPHETQNTCSTRTKTDDHGVVDAEDLDKSGSLGGEAVQENGDEADMDHANTEDDDEYAENIHATENHINYLQDVFRRGAAVVRLAILGDVGKCRGADVKLGEVCEGGEGHLPDHEDACQPQAIHRGEERDLEHQQSADDVAAGSETSRGGLHVQSAGAQGLHTRAFSPLSLRGTLHGA